MTPSFWHARWRDGLTGFHMDRPNPALKGWDAPDSAHVLVPLCGKSLDLHWLAERGHRVTGVELSSIACAAFFDDAGLQPDRTPVGAYMAWSHGPITLLEGDLFALEGRFEAVYDRAALIALPPDLRVRYATTLKRCVRGPGLLVTLEYDPAEREGPPWSVTDEEVHRLFTATLLEDESLEGDPFVKRAGLSWARERSYRCSF